MVWSGAGRAGGRRAGALLLVSVLVGLGPGAVPAGALGGPQREFTIGDPRITESSGLAASIRHQGVYWTHNDSGDGPYVYAVDSAGRTVATVTLRGVKPRDAEAISLGPDGRLYLADIGDNLDGSWPEVWLYSFAEPAELHDQVVDAVRYRVRYEDGPRNAEALMIHPVTGRAYIASKREQGGHLYQGPEKLSEPGINTFRRIADVPWVTDGAFSPDGTQLVLRGYFWSNLYRWQDGGPELQGPLDVPFQRQGESVTFSADGRSVLYGSEGRDSDVWRAQLPGAPAPGVSPGSPAPTTGRTPTAAATAATTGPKTSTDGHNGGVLLLVVAAVVAAVALRRRRSPR